MLPGYSKPDLDVSVIYPFPNCPELADAVDLGIVVNDLSTDPDSTSPEPYGGIY